MTYERKTTDEDRQQIRKWYYDIGTTAGDAVVAVLDDLETAEARIAELKAQVAVLRAAAVAESYCRLCRKVLLDGRYYEGHASNCPIQATRPIATTPKAEGHFENAR